MSYQVLARKYRPQRFSDVIGQEHVTRTLKNALSLGRIAHGYIFSGHRGIGKTTVARILAMALNCRSADKPVAEPCGVCDSCLEIRAGNSVDVIEIDAATNRGIDEIRELREAARYRPARDRYKIYILDEAHQITDAAFNALLKTLEEPPGHVVFMLATTQPEDIPQTIRSRCQHFSFHAVKFDDILRQLREIAGKENIVVEDDALALLAEAGDGSMRDALSILDQAIASTSDQITADGVRQLVGAAPSHTLEQVMEAVAQSDSESVLRLVDTLINEGHSPVHFARQMVRFLRNAVVAKVAGSDSQLLQISSDERARVARVAQLFSEEDLARYLQILLRTHSDLGYKQEQRFHLELGLLKMAHAQRLLPIEQLLSDAASGPATNQGRNPARTPSLPAGQERRGLAETSRPEQVSPFAADSARKTYKTEMSADASGGPRLVSGSSASPVIMGTAAPAPKEEAELAMAVPQVTSAPIAATDPAENPDTIENIKVAVLDILQSAHPMAASLLSGGAWKLEGNQPVVQVGASEATIKMTLGAEPLRAAHAAASSVVGRPVKLKVTSGGPVNGSRNASATPKSSNGTGRGRAAEDPIVRRMQEKFGAEIRTVIDHREKK
jgi:DNA polymerase III subunit gamma/tau